MTTMGSISRGQNTDPTNEKELDPPNQGAISKHSTMKSACSINTVKELYPSSTNKKTSIFKIPIRKTILYKKKRFISFGTDPMT